MKKLYLTLSLVIACITTNAQVVTTLAGSIFPGSADGTGAAAGFNWPTGAAYDGSGNLYIADEENNLIRKLVISTGAVTTIAGSGSTGSANGIGTAASFYNPTGVVVDGGNIYVVDGMNNEIRKIVISTGMVTTFAGSTTSGLADGTGTSAHFYYPYGICTDGLGNLYVSDWGNNEIRKIVISTAAVTTLAGNGGSGHLDGTGAFANFYGPDGICYDGLGNLYIGDTYNNEIRKIVISTAAVTTIAGTTTSGHADGTGTSASFYDPDGVVTDGSGNLFIVDNANHEIRKMVISTAAVTTFAGSTTSGHADGIGAAASFHNPTWITTDGTNLFVADLQNNEIREITNTITGMGQVNSSLGLNVYPNPASNMLTVELNSNGEQSRITIYNVLGEAMSTTTANNSRTNVDVSALAKGIYFVQVATDKQTEVVKFIKE